MENEKKLNRRLNILLGIIVTLYGVLATVVAYQANNLDDIINVVAAFLMPVVEAARDKRTFGLTWSPGGRWK